jgi:hypothetical protein
VHALAKGKYRTLAKLSLTESVAFAKAFVIFFDEAVEEFSTAKLTRGKSVHVVSTMKLALIEHVGEPRVGVIGSLQTTGDHAHIENARLMFRATLASLDKMAEVTALEFKNHPKVSNALVKFLAVNTGMDALVSLEERVVQLERDFKEALKTAKTASAAAASATSVLDALQKRVTRLESKAK